MVKNNKAISINDVELCFCGVRVVPIDDNRKVSADGNGPEPDKKCLFCIHRWECYFERDGVCKRGEEGKI